MRIIWLRPWVLALLCGSAMCAGQANDEAARALAAGDHAKAIQLYEQSLDANPNNAGDWEQLGRAYLQASRYADAAHAFQSAIDKGYASPYGKYNLACAYARLGEKVRALDLLAEVVSMRVPVPMAADPDLASLATEPRFLEMQKKVQAIKEPCKDAEGHPEYRQLDFWVGDWEVFSGTQLVGSSSVQRILKDCVVFESWKGLAGGEGKSFNKYNSDLKKWEQFWVSDSGTTTHYIGELVNGAMAYIEAPGTKAVIQRLTFTQLGEGRVRQLGETSSDGGKSWSVAYDFVYRIKNTRQ